MSQRANITNFVIKELGLPNDEKTFKRYNAIWWINPRKNGGLRLTELGANAFKSAKLKNYKIDFEKPLPVLPSKTLLQLNNYIDSPFYIGKDFVEVYTEKMAIQLVLFSGDILKFLDSKNRSKIAEKQH